MGKCSEYCDNAGPLPRFERMERNAEYVSLHSHFPPCGAGAQAAHALAAPRTHQRSATHSRGQPRACTRGQPRAFACHRAYHPASAPCSRRNRKGLAALLQQGPFGVFFREGNCFRLRFPGASRAWTGMSALPVRRHLPWSSYWQESRGQISTGRDPVQNLLF